MLIDTSVYLLSFTFTLPLLFRSVLSTERLEKVTLLSKGNLCGGLLFVDQKNLTDFSSATFVPYLWINMYNENRKNTIRNIIIYLYVTFACEKNSSSDRFQMHLKYTNIYPQFSKTTSLMLQNTESNTLPSELLIRIQKIINEKMWPSSNTTLNNSKEK